MKKIAILIAALMALGIFPGAVAAENTNLVLNPGFDTWRTDSGGEYQKASGWTASYQAGATPGADIFHDTDADTEEDTDFSLAMTPQQENTYVYANQYFPNSATVTNGVLPLATYKLSFYYYTEAPNEESKNVTVRVGFYDKYGDDKKGVSTSKTIHIGKDVSANTWTEFSTDIEMPAGCYCFWMSLQVAYPAKGYIDDVSLVRISEPRAATMETDKIFYYAEEIEANPCGEAVVTLNPAHADGRDVSAYGAVVSLLDGNEELFKSSERVSFAEGKATLPFELTKMEQKKKYTVRTQILNGREEVWTEESNVYVYPRPQNLDEAGNYRRQVFAVDADSPSGYVPVTQNGAFVFETEPFQPHLAYHFDRPKDTTPDEENMYKQAKKAGINLMQSQSAYSTPKDIKMQLDACEKEGLMALVCLNHDNKTGAGSASNAVNTSEVVKIAKNHPATFAYIVMDEPFSHMTDTMLSDLENAYTIIRNEDDVHPVFITDNNLNYFDEHVRYADIMSIDPYPQSAEKSAYYVKERIETAKKVAGNKPVYAVLQAFPYGSVDDGPKEDIGAYLPTGTQYLHMWYQAMVAGVDGIGFYELYSKGYQYYLYKTPELSELWNTMTTFADEELAKTYDFFQNSSVIKTVEGTDCTVQLRYFGGETYAVVLSKSHTEVESTALTVACDGKIRELYAGTAGNTVSIDGDTWTMQLAPSAASIYRLQTEGIIVSQSGTIVQSAEKGKPYTAEVMAIPKESGTVNLFAAVYQTSGTARELLQLISLDSAGAAAGEEIHLSGTFTVPASLTGANEIKVFALSFGTLQSLTGAVALPVS